MAKKKIDKWYLVETEDGVEIGFGAPNAKSGLTMTGGNKAHKMAWAEYIIRIHEKAQAKFLKGKRLLDN